MATHFETEYWQQFIKGDKDAFRVLYDHFVDVLYSYASHFCTDSDLIQDAIHDLFVDLHRYRSGLNPQANVQAYLFTALRRKVISGIEKSQKNATIYAQGDTLFQLEYNIEQQIIHHEAETEILERLQYELGRLTGRQKEALYLRFSSGLPYEQVARIMGVSVSTCRTFVYRAIQQLRLRMEDVSISQLLFITFWKKP